MNPILKKIMSLIHQGYNLNEIRILLRMKTSYFKSLLKSNECIEREFIRYKAEFDIIKINYLIKGKNPDATEYRFKQGMIKDIISYLNKVPVTHYRDKRQKKNAIESIMRFKNGMFENFIMKHNG